MTPKPPKKEKALAAVRRAKGRQKREPIYVRVTAQGVFEPASAYYAQLCRERAYRVGDLLRAEFTKGRYPKHHRLVFALLKKVLDNQEGLVSVKQLLTIVKIKLGYCDTILDTSGKVFYVPQSIAFDAMDQGEFSVFWKGLCALVRRDYFPHLDDDQVAELAEMLDDEP